MKSKLCKNDEGDDVLSLLLTPTHPYSPYSYATV